MMDARNRAILDFTVAFCAKHEYGPTIREIADGVMEICEESKTPSSSIIANRVDKLIASGFIRRIPIRDRNLRATEKGFRFVAKIKQG